jgi:ABC-2 type transport system permease protein
MTAPSYGALVPGAPVSGNPVPGASYQAAPGVPARPSRRPATFADAVHAEWIKLRTLRSTYITLAIAVVLTVGLGALISWATASHYATSSLSNKATWDPTSNSLSGLGLAQLAVAVLGVMAVAGEYSSGMIRTTLAAVPRRSRWFTAKAAVFTVVFLVVGEVVSFVAFLIGQPIIGSYAGVPNATLGDPGVLRAVIGGGLYVAVIGLLAIAFAAIVRNTAGGIAIIVGLIYVLPLVLEALPDSWRHPVEKYWPTQAGSQVSDVVRTAHTLGPWSGFLDFVVFTAIVVAVAFVFLLRRDA